MDGAKEYSWYHIRDSTQGCPKAGAAGRTGRTVWLLYASRDFCSRQGNRYSHRALEASHTEPGTGEAGRDAGL